MVKNTITNNKRIAYNTIILYIKLILSIIIGLYTSRYILVALGVSDYGLYTVVGGIVSLLNVIGVTMVSTSYRYISIEIGKGDQGDVNKVYNTVFIIHVALALLLVLVGTSIGILYIDNYLNVDEGKLADARYVLIVSMITTAISIIAVPSNGLIIAREKFLLISSTELVQLLLKLLLIVIVLIPYGGNRLILYTNLMAVVAVLSPLVYTLYCYNKEYSISKWHFNSNGKDYSSVLRFAGWMMVSTVSFMGVQQGAAMIMNSFFGTVVNAAYGISSQIQSYVLMAPRNVLQAASPQIIKKYGGGDNESSLILVYRSTKYCFFILLIVMLPCVLFINEILQFWLVDVPPLTATFTSFMLIASLVGSLTNGLDPYVMASGKILVFQLNYAVINLLLLPIIYFLYKWGFPAYSNAIVLVFLNVLSVIFQLVIVKKITEFSIKNYFINTIRPALLVIFSVSPLLLLRSFIECRSFAILCAYVLIAVIWELISIFLVGLQKDEKIVLLSFIKSHLRKRNYDEKDMR